MRIRSIRPEFWSSEDVAALDWSTRLVFIGLWSYVDDNGVGRDVLKLIVAALFPLDDDQSESSRRVAAGISALVEGGQVTRYMVAGKPYLHVTSWATHQRTDNKAKDRYPLPTCEDAEPAEVVGDLAANRGETPPSAAMEKGRRGEGEKVADAPRPDVDLLCEHLYKRVLENGGRVLINKSWREAARLMLDRDQRPEQEAHQLIDWCQDSSFWRANVMGMPKFREKYDQLRLQAADRGGLRIVNGKAQDLTATEIENILGVDYWQPPEPPPEMSSDEGWEWQRMQRIDHIAQRQVEARRRLGVSA